VEAIAPVAEDHIVEIGPGEGALTGLLLERVPELEAIEIDRDLAAALKEKFPRLRLHCADALAFDFSRLPAGARLVGNLPYNISTPLLFRLAEQAAGARDLHFMLQNEVVERMVAEPSTSEYGRLSVALQTRFRMTKLFRVAPGAFRPAPKVESAVVRLVPHRAGEQFDETYLEQLLRRAFSARRKTLRNALAGVDVGALGIDPGLRPEDLSPEDYLRITRRFGAR
jgi:16S rRNA (adenine1518-N6/adenine1519-N6)-dimethyltransferase